MPPSPKLSASTHLDVARRFQDEALQLRPTFAGWGITCAFYAAAHFVRAYLVARHRVNVDSHKETYSEFGKHGEMSGVRRPYEKLETLSRSHRYLNRTCTPEEVDLVLKDYVGPVRDWCEREIRIHSPESDPGFAP